MYKYILEETEFETDFEIKIGDYIQLETVRYVVEDIKRLYDIETKQVFYILF